MTATGCAMLPGVDHMPSDPEPGYTTRAAAMSLGVDPEAARSRVARWVRRTPVVDSGHGAFGLRDSVAMKLECLQYAGSFKARGGFNSALGADIPAAGLIAASGGNHGLAVAYVANALGVPAEIFVPQASSPVKVRRIRDLGAEVHVVGALYDDARIACNERAAESGALDIHPYDAPLTVSGQATAGLELMEQVSDLDTVIVAIGGGGLVAGLAAALPDIVRIVGVEPEGSACYRAATEAARPIDVEIHSVAADSLGARRLGSISWDIVSNRVESVLVTDAAIVDTRIRIWEDARLVVEPGGATAMAALTSGAYEPARGERVAVVVCGSNTDPADLVART